MAKPNGIVLLTEERVLKSLLAKKGQTVSEILHKIGVRTTSGPPYLGRVLKALMARGQVTSAHRKAVIGRPPRVYFLAAKEGPVA